MLFPRENLYRIDQKPQSFTPESDGCRKGGNETGDDSESDTCEIESDYEDPTAQVLLREGSL